MTDNEQKPEHAIKLMPTELGQDDPEPYEILWHKDPTSKGRSPWIAVTRSGQIMIQSRGMVIQTSIERLHECALCPNVPEQFVIDGVHFTLGGLRHFAALVRQHSRVLRVQLIPVNGRKMIQFDELEQVAKNLFKGEESE